MAVERLTGPADLRAADYGVVADASLVRSRGLFVAEGRFVVSRVIADGRYRLRSVLLSDASYRSLETILAAVDPSVPIYVCATGDFRGITGHDFHRGCLALAERPAAVSQHSLLARAGADVIVVLEGVTDPDNVGGVFRNAAAFGAGAVLLSPTCCDPLYRKAIRTSMAATLRVPYARVDDWPGCLQALRARGFTIAALTPREPSVSLDDFATAPRPKQVALVVGIALHRLSSR
jgi:tRNA G18 (ribose-2'-O)-methylase SpoU